MTDKKYKDFIRPMLAKVAKEAFSGPAWLFEIKWDGYRAIADLRGSPVRLYSRNGLSFAEKYYPVYEALKKMRQLVVMDGEIVVMNEKGLPDFQKLQDFGNDGGCPIFYYVFDLLYHRGKDIRDRPLSDRKSLLKKVIKKDGIIRYCDHVMEEGNNFFDLVVEKGMEGVMAKKADSLYYAGRRSDAWLKIRNNLVEEAVIAGFTEPRGSRKYFGALILGRYDKRGKLTYTGHTGTGFDGRTLKRLHSLMEPLIRKDSPFDKSVPVNNRATWLEPELVCNIKFTEWTKDGVMRHPVFRGLRVDKTAKEVKA